MKETQDGSQKTGRLQHHQRWPLTPVPLHVTPDAVYYLHQNKKKSFQHFSLSSSFKRKLQYSHTIYFTILQNRLTSALCAKIRQKHTKRATRLSQKCTFFIKAQSLLSSARKQQTFAAQNRKSTTSVTV